MVGLRRIGLVHGQEELRPRCRAASEDLLQPFARQVARLPCDRRVPADRSARGREAERVRRPLQVGALAQRVAVPVAVVVDAEAAEHQRAPRPQHVVREADAGLEGAQEWLAVVAVRDIGRRIAQLFAQGLRAVAGQRRAPRVHRRGDRIRRHPVVVVHVRLVIPPDAEVQHELR